MVHSWSEIHIKIGGSGYALHPFRPSQPIRAQYLEGSGPLRVLPSALVVPSVVCSEIVMDQAEKTEGEARLKAALC